ncbi:MAG: hypothetical protein Kow0069_08230 [Promethearchaeota archaeon]
MVRLNDAHKYPWLRSAVDFFPEEITQDLVQFVRNLSSRYPGVYDLLERLVDLALDRREVVDNFHPGLDFLVCYPFMRIFVNAFNNSALTYALANLYSKHASHLLGSEREEVLLRFARDLGWDLLQRNERLEGKVYKFQMAVANYVKYSVKMKDPNWKLSNKLLQAGRVWLGKDGVVRLMEEHVKREVIRATEIDLGGLVEQLLEIPEFHDLVERVKEKMKDKRVGVPASLDWSGVRDPTLAFPPCVQLLFSKSAAGENLSHFERVFFAFFLLNVDYSVEQVLEVFKSSPDYNEKIARYQVEHAAGKRGSGKRYSVHSCGKLQSYGVCAAKHPEYGHPLCASGKIRHPLQFVRFRVRDLKAGGEQREG